MEGRLASNRVVALYIPDRWSIIDIDQLLHITNDELITTWIVTKIGNLLIPSPSGLLYCEQFSQPTYLNIELVGAHFRNARIGNKLTDCTLRMSRRQQRKRAGIDHSKSVNSIDSGVTINNRHWVTTYTHLAGAGWMPQWHQ